MLRLDSDKCCGCTACVSICPQQCLEMVEDTDGFLIPRLKDDGTCLNCDLCNVICPVLSPRQEHKSEQQGYIVQHADKRIRAESTSGGAFSAISRYVLEHGGIVYGAAYDKSFQVVHTGIETEDDLWKLRNSKYVQSIMNDTFSEVKQNLRNGRMVCFSGTPCQVEGLRSFLRKEYDNLLLVDVVCHGVGSPLIWNKYLETQEELPDHIYFRWKHYGYKYSTMSHFKAGKEVYFNGVESDAMLRAYFTNSCDRLTCYDCPFKKRYRVSDITIWDCFQPGYFDKSFDDDTGTTSVLVHSTKGQRYFDEILKCGCLKYSEVAADELVFGNHEMVGSVPKGAEREKLLQDARRMSGKVLFEKYYPATAKSKLKKIARLLLLKLGIYKSIKYLLFLKRRKQTHKE